MMQVEKCVEYYFDSKEYSKIQVLETMKKEQLGFEKKKSKIDIHLNEHGIYVVKLKFLDKRYEIYTAKNKTFGKYKETKTFQPI